MSQKLFCIKTALVYVFALTSLSFSMPLTAATDEPVVVAIAGPMVGTSFSVGVQYRVGVTAAIQSLAEGRLLGRRIEVSAFDDSCNPEIARSLALDMMQQPPAVVIGHSCSFATIAAAPVYAEHDVLQITPASTNPQVTEMGIKTLFRMIGRDDVQGRIAAHRLATLHRDQRIGIVFFPGAYSKGLSSITIDLLSRQGLKPVSVVQAPASAASYTAEIQALMDAEVEVLYIVGGALDSGVFVRQSAQFGAQYQIISSDTLITKIFLETAGDAAENIPFTFPPEAARLATSTPAIKAIKGLGQEPVGYTLLAYAAAEVWIAAVKKAGSFDTKQVSDAIRGEPIDTILGKVSFDSKGDIITSYPAFTWNVWKDGKRLSLE